MRAHSRAGGKVVPLAKLGLTVLATLGLGLPAPHNVALPLALPGGEHYQRTTSPARDFDLVGVLQGAGPDDLDRDFAGLVAALDVTRQPKPQPLILAYQAQDDCGEPAGERVEIECSLAGGLDGAVDNHYRLDVPLRFRIHLPFVGYRGGSEGAVLDVRDTLTNADGGVYRDRDGIWHVLGYMPEVALWLPDGRILFGGLFVNAGGDANADFLAIYDPSTGTTAAVNATPLNNPVYALLQLPDGTVAVGGEFTNAGGNANADFLCRLNLATGAFSAFNATPLSGGLTAVYALALLPDGTAAVGGEFLNAGGDGNADYLARLNPITGAYSAFTTTPLNNFVRALATAPKGQLLIGGEYTNAGGVANADYFALLSPSNNYSTFSAGIRPSVAPLGGAVYSIGILSSGRAALAGGFTGVQGVTGWDYLAIYNGTNFEPSVQGINGQVYKVAEAAPGVFFIAGAFDTIEGLALYDSLAQISGSTVLPLDLDLPAPLAKTYVNAKPETGEVVVGFNNTGNAFTSGSTVVINSGTARAYPVITLAHPTTASANAPLNAIRNRTTRQTISFDLTLLIGETVTLDLVHKTITSDVRGSLRGAILPGSHFETFHLAPGENIIDILSVVSSGNLPAATAWWTPAYKALADATR